MNFLRNLIQGPVAAGGLGGPPDTEGPREAVITQENTSGSSTSPPLSPASTQSDASLPGLTQECDPASTADDNTTVSSSSTPCVTCESEPPSCSGASEANHSLPQDTSRLLESTGNSDSEYESAEELDSVPHSSPQSEEVPRVPIATAAPEAEGGGKEECVNWESDHPPVGDSQTETDLPPLSPVITPSSGETPNQATVDLVNGVETDDSAEATPVIHAETLNAAPDTVNGAESEQPVPTTVCESILTVTKNEVIEESVVENTVLVEQQVISATHTTTHCTSELEKPVDISDINLDIVTSGGDGEAGSCAPPTCVPVDVSEAKETTSGEVERTFESQVDGKVTEERIVPEATSKEEHTAYSSEVSPAAPQETEQQSVLKSEEPQDARDTPSHIDTEPHTAVENTSPASSLLPEQAKESLPPLPSQEARETTVTPDSEQQTTVESTSEVASSPPEQEEESPPPLPPPDPDDIPIVPKKGYNLDFLDNLDDPNFNPFASTTAIRNTPPPSPEPGCKLPPLKPAIKKKGKKTPEAATDNQEPEVSIVSESQVEVNTQDQSSRERVVASPPPSQDTGTTSEPQKEEAEQKAKPSVLEIPLDDGDSPAKTPVKPVRKPPQRKPLRKTPLKPKVTEKNNNRVEEKQEEEVSQVLKEEEDLPIPPSKGYNLDFLDNLDDPNFNPFSSKTSVRNSPPSSEAVFPASQSSQETAGEEEAKVVVATKKSSPKKGFAVPKKSREVKSKSPVANEGSLSQTEKKQEPIATSDTKKPETSPSKEEPKEEEELPVPKKGYNLDFLDDPNFDPFQTVSSLDKANSGAKTVGVKSAEDSVITNNSAKGVEDTGKHDLTSESASPEEKQTELVSEPTSESDKEVSADSAVPRETPEEEIGTEEFSVNQVECAEESLNSELTGKPKNQSSEPEESYATKDANQINQTVNQNLVSQSLGPDSENNWSTENKADAENTEPHSGVFRTPSIGTIGQLDSLEFEELLEHEASRIAEEFMNCSKDSGLADYDESPENNHNYSNHSAMANTSCTNIRQVDENVNPFQKSSGLANSPPLGKRGAVCGAESTDSPGPPFFSRRALKRDIVLGEERLDTSSLEDDSGIVLGSRSDLEEEVNHSEAGPEIATGLTSSDLKCASQFFKEAIDLDMHARRTMLSPITGSHSKLVGDDVTPTKDKKEPPAGAPESPQNKPTPSTSSPAPPPREERSAPEGTSSPSPRPSDAAERKSHAARPTSAPPEGYMTASEVQELLKRQELKFEEKLLRVELAAGEKEKKLQQTMKDEQKELQTLGSSVTELTQSRDALLKMVGQYKGMLASLVAEKEKEKKASEEKITALQAERDQALEDLANVEVAFSDVHRKYERTKQVVDTLKRNEETLRGAVADYEAKLKKQEQKFLEFQKHAEEKIQLANEEFESMRKSNEQEMTKMAALLKKAEMKIMSLQDSFDRKTRENQELTQLCDDLINKVGTSH